MPWRMSPPETCTIRSSTCAAMRPRNHMVYRPRTSGLHVTSSALAISCSRSSNVSCDNGLKRNLAQREASGSIILTEIVVRIIRDCHNIADPVSAKPEPQSPVSPGDVVADEAEPRHTTMLLNGTPVNQVRTARDRRDKPRQAD